MEHDIFATNTHPDTLEPNIFQNRYNKNTRDLHQNKTILVISIGVFVLGLFMYAIDFLLFDVLHDFFDVPFVLSFFPIIGFLCVIAGLGGVAYALIYTYALKKHKRVLEIFRIDDSAIRQFESERASGRSKAFGDVGSRTKAFCILTENWLYCASMGTLIPLREVVSTHRFSEFIHRMGTNDYLKITYTNNMRSSISFNSNIADLALMQDALRQLLPNAQHTSEL
jgi:hypothetical protein